MYTVRLCFYGELSDFIGTEPRGTQYERRFPQARSVKDLIESEGVPHPEIDRILVNGKPQMLDALVIDGDCICVYPSEQSVDFSVESHLGRPTLSTPQLMADVHLGKLTRLLRLLGMDCEYDNFDWTPISREEATSRVPPATWLNIETFHHCPDCRRVYWQGAHWDMLNAFVERVKARFACTSV